MFAAYCQNLHQSAACPVRPAFPPRGQRTPKPRDVRRLWAESEKNRTKLCRGRRSLPSALSVRPFHLDLWPTPRHLVDCPSCMACPVPRRVATAVPIHRFGISESAMLSFMPASIHPGRSLSRRDVIRLSAWSAAGRSLLTVRLARDDSPCLRLQSRNAKLRSGRTPDPHHGRTPGDGSVLTRCRQWSLHSASLSSRIGVRVLSFLKLDSSFAPLTPRSRRCGTTPDDLSL